MTTTQPVPSALSASSPRRGELLERAYAYVLAHGLGGLSLRPLAAAIGSSPRVLLFLFGSKDGLLRALLERARADELTFLEHAAGAGATAGLPAVVRRTWEWLSADRYRPLLTFWVEAYAASLTEPGGAWGDFARQTVDDWLVVLAAAQPPGRRESAAGAAERTLALAVLRGALLDLLATGERDRLTDAVERYLGEPAPRGAGQGGR